MYGGNKCDFDRYANGYQCIGQLNKIRHFQYEDNGNADSRVDGFCPRAISLLCLLINVVHGHGGDGIAARLSASNCIYVTKLIYTVN